MMRHAAAALPPAVGFLAAIGAWQLILSTGVLPPGSLPYPGDIATQLLHLLSERSTWIALWQTLWSAVVGLAIAIVMGVVLGTVIGRIRIVDDSTSLLVQFLRPIPPIALLPLTLLLLGPSEEMKIVLVAWGCVWPILLQTADGVRSIEPLALQVARSYRVGKSRTWRSVVIPAVSPYIMTGVRVSASVSLLVAITTELIGGAKGIGKMTANAGLAGQTSSVYAWVLLAGMLGVAVNFALLRLERRVLFWHGAHRLSGYNPS
jgi:ABC-type nitrate/sulfonate/bicarbonate transport system permease component